MGEEKPSPNSTLSEFQNHSTRIFLAGVEQGWGETCLLKETYGTLNMGLQVLFYFALFSVCLFVLLFCFVLS